MRNNDDNRFILYLIMCLEVIIDSEMPFEISFWTFISFLRKLIRNELNFYIVHYLCNIIANMCEYIEIYNYSKLSAHLSHFKIAVD